MAATWREALRDLLLTFPLGEITLPQIYEASASLAADHPHNKSVEATIRRELQNLRDEGTLEFLGNGIYRRAQQPQPTALPLGPGPVTHSEPGVPDSVPLEQLKASAYLVPAAASKEAVRNEQLLVADFDKHLAGIGHQGTRWRIPTTSNGSLYTDICDSTTGILYEAKAESTRESVRMAIGQLLDYRRYLPGLTGISILLSTAPSQDMLDLLLDLGIGCTHRIHGGFVNALDPASA